MLTSRIEAMSNGFVPLHDITFAVTADTGSLQQQAVWLCKSIRRHYPDAPIVTFVPDSAKGSLAPSTERYIERETDVEYGQIPIPEDRQSALTESFILASERSTTEYVVSLDTDTLLVNPISVPDSGSELFLKPVDIGAGYWSSCDSHPEWRRLYDAFNINFPDERHLSTVDTRRMLPLWNGGVVITSDMSLAEDWLETSRAIMSGDYFTSDMADDRFNDQVSLALVAQKREARPLTERQNYPLVARLRCPSDAEILHYHNQTNLNRILNPVVRDSIRESGIDLRRPSPVTLISQLLDVVYHQSGRVLNYQQKSAVMKFAKRLLPDSVLNAKRDSPEKVS